MKPTQIINAFRFIRSLASCYYPSISQDDMLEIRAELRSWFQEIILLNDDLWAEYDILQLSGPMSGWKGANLTPVLRTNVCIQCSKGGTL